jgi:hypothetical protein
MENNFDIKKFLIENKLTRLSEQDDDWDLEAEEEWNIKDLSVGDYITPEMFNDSVFTKTWRDATKDIKIVNFFHNSLGDGFVIEYIGSSGKIRQDNISVETFNKHFLKPGYQIVPPLNESDDEWDFEAGPEWNTTELSDGDYITQDMWEDPYKGSFPRDIWQIMGIDEEWDNIALEGNERGYISWSISGIQNLLKSEYKIVENKNLYEQQDDDWDLEAGDEWNVTELGIGDHITLDMLNQDNQPHLKHFLAVFEPNTFPLLIDKGNFNNYVVLRPEKGERGRIWTIKVMNNIFLKPEYQIVFP